MKPILLGLAITTLLLISTNSSFAFTFNTVESSVMMDQNFDDEQPIEKEKENIKKNKESIEHLDEIIKNLEAEKKTEKAALLKAMRDHIKKNLKDDPATVLDQAADKGKDATFGKENKKELKAYVDKIHSAIAKMIFNLGFLAKGTGRTTGHIIDLTVTNNSSEYFYINAELAYIHIVDRYQSYVVYLPPYITIPPGAEMVIPLDGFCANPHVPPVPLGDEMPDPSGWIPIDETPSGGFTLEGNPSIITEPKEPSEGSADPPGRIIDVYVSDVITLPSFDPGMITRMEESPGFTVDDGAGSDADIEVTWPKTDRVVGGTFNPVADPEAFAQIAVEGLLSIVEVVDSIQSSGDYITPFSHDKKKEQQAILQQTFWIFVAGLTGEDYDKEDFTENIYTQYETATGQDVETLPAEQRAQIDDGAADFWNVYTATGVKAKVLGTERPSSPVYHPEETEPEDDDCCESTVTFYVNPQLDFDMKIADQWGNAEERHNIIRTSRQSMVSNIDLRADEVFDEYDTNKNPTSATSFWKPAVVGGFASAYAKTWFKKDDGSWEWVWGTEKLDTDAEGIMNFTLAYDPGEDCRAMVAGTSVIRIRASSTAFDAMAGNNQDEDSEDQLAFLRTTKYAAKQALEWLILRGRGRTNQSFQNHVRDDLQSRIEGEVIAEIESEVQGLADEYLGQYLEQLGLSADDLTQENLQGPDLIESLEELLGINIPTLSDLENFISDGIDASLNLFFVSNTYARADGFLVAHVGGNSGEVRAHTSVHYGRQSTENTSDAMSWTGEECKQSIISDVKENALTIRTHGDVNMVSEAASKFGFGNGSAKAYLESMNLQMLAGICIYEKDDSVGFKIDVVGNLSWYGNTDEHQDSLTQALEPLENQIRDSLVNAVNEFKNTPGNRSLENYTGEMLRNTLEQSVRSWARKNPYYWSNCTNE